jgi:VCBS repeat-containing protein
MKRAKVDPCHGDFSWIFGFAAIALAAQLAVRPPEIAGHELRQEAQYRAYGHPPPCGNGFDLDARDVQALNVGNTLTDTFTVTTVDGTAQVVTVAIHGTNDAAIISGTTTGSVIEAGYAAPGTPSATGTLTDTDVDNTPNTFTAVSSPTASAGGYGTFTMTAAGVWAYTLNEANSVVQALNVCDTLTDTFTVTTVDGTAQVVKVAIHGTNDAAFISGTTTGSVIEAGCDTHGTPTATGTLTDTDVDNAPNTFTAVCPPTASDAGYGTFTMTAAGVWTYTLDNANCAVRALNACNTLTDTFKVTTVDGTAQVVTITIHGTSEAEPNHFRSLYGDSLHFKDEIFGHEGSGATGLADVNFTPASISHHDAPPAISEPAQPSGQHSADNFSLVPDHTTGGVVTHVPHDLMV